MTRFLLDTNIVSDAVKPRPSVPLGNWLSAQEDNSLYITSISIAEILRGVFELPESRKRTGLETWFYGGSGPIKLFAGRILPFEEKAAAAWARLTAKDKSQGRPRGDLDAMIAAIALVNACIVVTLNERDFAGVEVLNPTRESP